MEPGTIKDRVLHTARRDPYLTVEEIAQTVGTTPRYVRTILSEARLSLMELRKRYAKRMEQQLVSPTSTSQEAAAGLTQELHVRQLQAPVTAQLLGRRPDEKLYQMSQLERTNGVAIYVELTTWLEIPIWGSTENLRSLLERSSTAALIPGESSAEVCYREQALTEMLQSDAHAPILKISTVLYCNGTAVALETCCVPSEGVQLRWRSNYLCIERRGADADV